MEKLFKIVEKLSICCEHCFPKRKKKLIFLERYTISLNILDEELKFFLHNNGESEEKIKLSKQLVNKINKLFQFNESWKVEKSNKLDKSWETEGKTWKELRFLIFEFLVKIFGHHCGYNHFSLKKSNEYDLISRHLHLILASMLNENVWLQSLSFAHPDKFYCERYKNMILFLILMTSGDDEYKIHEILWSSEANEIKIPLIHQVMDHIDFSSSPNLGHVSSYTKKFYMVQHLDSYEDYNGPKNITIKQIRFLGRFTDPSFCQIRKQVTGRAKFNIESHNQFFAQLFVEERLIYEKMKNEKIVAIIAATLKLLNSLQFSGQRFLLPEINQIIIRF